MLVSTLTRHNTKSLSDTADNCSTAAAAQRAVTRVADVAIETADIQNRMRRNRAHLKAEKMMCTAYSRELLRRMFEWVSKNLWITAVKLFTARKESSLLMIVKLPSDGILCVSIGTMDIESDE